MYTACTCRLEDRPMIEASRDDVKSMNDGVEMISTRASCYSRYDLRDQTSDSDTNPICL